MAIFKCKMCGGTLEINNNESVFECEYCGTTQTLPKLDNDKKTDLYDRANHFRRNNEYDKAMGIYEHILNEDKTDAEAYWSLVLCRYGIEYVEDPATHKRVPTVNRAQYTSIFDDSNYKSALQYADTLQKSIYEEEAKTINEIQKGILEISQKEEPFDVFICYKETDNNGRRIPDSVLANDLYHQLTQEGFKVFFARITLEDKLGSAYEPYIFAALNSAKVMVVLGTKPEFFKAVWVRNEWSRYLSLIKNGEKKQLIPAYKDMDPYDLPEEFSHLQAQDMSKLGFMQDLIRGIKKITGEDEVKQAVVKETVISSAVNTDVAPLLERVFIFLEDEEWDSANEYCEKVLDIEPKNVTAYLGKLLAELRVNNKEELKNCAHPFDENSTYKKLLRFADYSLKNELAEYIEYINDRVEEKRNDEILAKAQKLMRYNDISQYKKAIELLESIQGWKNSNEEISFCKEKIEKLALQKKSNLKIYGMVAIVCCALVMMFVLLGTVIIPKMRYNSALSLINEGKYVEAYEILSSLDGYEDSDEKLNEIRGKKNVEKLKDVKVGDYIIYGMYEQDNNMKNGQEEIEWLVLEVKDGRALVISKCALDCKPYNTQDKATTWEKCSIRSWLNSDFITDAFTTDERNYIFKTTVTADRNPEYSTNPGNDTQDEVFLLSITEVNKYFSGDTERQCTATEYAKNNGAYTNDFGYCVWWLRSPGEEQDKAVHVYFNGEALEHGNSVDYHAIAVRPAMWINLDI